MLRSENIFIISLPERKYDRLDLLTAEMDNYNFEYTMWSAIKDNNGAKGLVITMQALFGYCLKNRLDGVWIIEDDATFLTSLIFIDECISELPENFDMLYFGGYLPKPVKELYSEHLFRIEIMYSTHSIYYSRSGMEKTLALIEESISKGNTRALDQLIVTGIQRAGNCYCAFPAIMKQRSSYSDIEKIEVDYTRYHEELFDEYTRHLRLPNLS